MRPRSPWRFLPRASAKRLSRFAKVGPELLRLSKVASGASVSRIQRSALPSVRPEAVSTSSRTRLRQLGNWTLVG